MRKAGILNAKLCSELAALGHTDYLVIADPGLPLPKDVTVIDLALINGVPSFKEVFDAIVDELVIESFIYANEMVEFNNELLRHMQERLHDKQEIGISHEAFKKMLPIAKVIIRTGECTSYANVILEGGVDFGGKVDE